MPLHIPDRKHWPPSRLAGLATALIGAAATGAGFGIVAGLLFGISLGGLALAGAYYEARENEDKERQIDNARLSVTFLVMSPTPEVLDQLRPLAFDYQDYLRLKSGRSIADSVGTARHTPPVAWGRPSEVQHPEEPAAPPSPPSEPAATSAPPTMKALEQRIREQEEQIRRHFLTEDYYDYYTRRSSSASMPQQPINQQDELPSQQPQQGN
jgi:hypothetical protein